MSALKMLYRQPRWVTLAGALAAVAGIGWLDYVADWEWNFSLAYALLIALVVWKADRRVGFLFATLCASIWVVAQLHDHPYSTVWSFVLEAVTLLIYFAFVVIAVAAVKARRETDRARIQGLEHERELEGEILRVSEEEKRRIGRDLHDGLGPHLAAIGYAATFLADELRGRSNSESEKAEQLCGMANNAILLARSLARGIFPVQMDGAGLSTALEDLARTTSELTGVQVSYRETGEPRIADPEAAMHFYRIAQEAVNNAIKHAGGSAVAIVLRMNPESMDLIITDDGRGMEIGQGGEKGMGLHSMQYRARALGTELKIESKPNGGTVIVCSVPMPG